MHLLYIRFTDWLYNIYNLGILLQLPYYIDGDIKICESSAIIRYLARKYDLYGKDEQEAVRADMVDFKLHDFKWRFYDFAYGTGIVDWELVRFRNETRNWLGTRLGIG